MSLPNPFPLNIAEKQDTFAKLQLMANVPDEFKYLASDFNKFVAGLNWMYENLPATAGTAVEKRYATIAAMLADQAGQSVGKFMFVTDATADAQVASGYAYYEKLLGSTGSLENYKRVSAEDLTAVAFKGGLAIADTPTGSGFWLPTESGTYTNAGSIVVDLTAGLTVLAYDGADWSSVVVPIDLEAYTQKEYLFDQVVGKNLLDTDDIVEGRYLSHVTGLEIKNTLSTMSGYIDVKPSTFYTVSGRNPGSNARAAMVFYDEEDNIMKPYDSSGVERSNYSTGAGNETIISPPTAVKVRMTLSFGEGLEAYKDTVQFEENNEATNYEPYTLLDVIKESLIPFFEQYALKTDLENFVIKEPDIFRVKIEDENTYLLRSSYSEERDCVSQMITNVNANGVINFLGSRSLTKNEPTSISGGYQLFGSAGDDASSITINDISMGGNHGVSRMRTITSAGHGKTLADVGSVWEDSLGVKFTLLIVLDENTIRVLPENINTTGGWTFPAPTGSTLVSVSPAENTSDITIDSFTTGQLFPATKHNFQKCVVDGVEVSEVGEYFGRDIKLVEEYEIIDPVDMAEKLVLNRPSGGYLEHPGFLDGISMATIKLTYQMVEGGMIIYGEMMSRVQFEFYRYGITQHGMLNPNWSNHYRKYMPSTLPISDGTTSFDFRTGADFLTESVLSSLFFTNEYWENNTPPSRTYDVAQNTGTGRYVVFNMGYLPIADSHPEIRKDQVNEAWWIGTSKKSYPRVVTGESVNDVDGTSLSPARNFSAAAFRIWREKDQVTNKAFIKFGDKYYVVIDAHEIGNFKFIAPKDMYGKELKILNKTPNMKVLTKVVQESIDVAVVALDNGYSYLEAVVE